MALPKYSISDHHEELFNSIFPFQNWEIDDRINTFFLINTYRARCCMKIQDLIELQAEIPRKVNLTHLFNGDPLQREFTNELREIQHHFTSRFGKALPYVLLGRWRYHTRLMVRADDSNELKSWIQYLQMKEKRSLRFLNPAIVEAMKYGVPATLALIQDQWEATFPGLSLAPHLFKWAVVQGSLDSIKYLFAQGRLDSKLSSSCHYPHGPLWLVIHQAPVGQIEDILRYLLENGADPNEPNGAKTTQFQSAVIKANFDAAEVLLEQGADLEIDCVMKTHLWGVNYHRVISMEPCTALARLLWPNGEGVSPYKTGRKKFALSRDQEAMDNIEKAFIGLGWRSDQVYEMQWDYYIDAIEDIPGVAKK